MTVALLFIVIDFPLQAKGSSTEIFCFFLNIFVRLSFSRGKLRRRRRRNDLVSVDGLAYLFDFIFVIYARLLPEWSGSSQGSRNEPLECQEALTCQKIILKNIGENVCCIEAYTCPHHPILLFISLVSCSFFFQKKNKKGHPFVNLGIFIICPCRQTDQRGKKRRKML